MKYYCINFFLLFYALSSCSQPKKIGGTCEGCEAIYENHIPFDKLPDFDSLPGYYEKGNKLLIQGRVLQSDGRTPAADVVLYIYHTDAQGIYPTKGNEKGWERRHGNLRGWLKTNKKGEYGFLTTRPGSYPQSNNPAHIHMTIKEPGKNEYWIDEFHFADDPLLTPEIKKGFKNRGGNGITTTVQVNGITTGSRVIVLGKNIPGYP